MPGSKVITLTGSNYKMKDVYNVCMCFVCETNALTYHYKST